MDGILKIKKEILLIYGSGGHNEEARRLLDAIKPYLNGYSFVSICDDDVRFILTKTYYKIRTVTDKYSYFKVILKIPSILIQAFLFFRKIRNVVTIFYLTPWNR